MVLSFILGDPEETLCGWICSAFLMTQMTTPGSPGMSFSVQLPYPITKLPSHHLKTQVSSGYFTRGVRS